MRRCYIVIQMGVYRHGIFGPWDNQEEARAYADRLARSDSDSYHSYDVVPLERTDDIPTAPSDWWRRGGLDEDDHTGDEVYSVCWPAEKPA